MNSSQKIIKAVIIPIVLFFFAMLIGSSFEYGPFDLEEPQAIILWLFYCIVIGFIEYSIFKGDRNKEKKSETENDE